MEYSLTWDPTDVGHKYVPTLQVSFSLFLSVYILNKIITYVYVSPYRYRHTLTDTDLCRNAQGVNAQLNSSLSTLHSLHIQNQSYTAAQLKQM